MNEPRCPDWAKQPNIETGADNAGHRVNYPEVSPSEPEVGPKYGTPEWEAAYRATGVAEAVAPEPKPGPKICSWCKTNATEAAARHEGPHSTWCVYFRNEQRGGRAAPASHPGEARKWIEKTSQMSGWDVGRILQAVLMYAAPEELGKVLEAYAAAKDHARRKL